MVPWAALCPGGAGQGGAGQGDAGQGGASTAVWGNTCVPCGRWRVAAKTPRALGGAAACLVEGQRRAPLTSPGPGGGADWPHADDGWLCTSCLTYYNYTIFLRYPPFAISICLRPSTFRNPPSLSLRAVLSIYFLPCPALRGSRSPCISLCVSFSTSGVSARYTRREAPGGVSVSLAAARRAPTRTGWTGSDWRHCPATLAASTAPLAPPAPPQPSAGPLTASRSDFGLHHTFRSLRRGEGREANLKIRCRGGGKMKGRSGPGGERCGSQGATRMRTAAHGRGQGGD